MTKRVLAWVAAAAILIGGIGGPALLADHADAARGASAGGPGREGPPFPPGQTTNPNPSK